MGESFTHFVDLIRQWLEGARPHEIARLLELIGEELRRRGYSLTWTTTPPIPPNRSTD